MPKIFSTSTDFANRFRSALTHVDALPQLSILAIIIGSFTGLLIVCFRIALETPSILFPISSAESFEELTPMMRVNLILSGSLAIALALKLLKPQQRQMSVGHVIDRLHNFQGKMPGANWIAQFLLCILSICSGQSVGREGPAVHLGAGAASHVGKWLRLPNNSMHTLIACGVAAAISASFDTPLAGVIFAMEVIVMEYSIVGFVPVILAAVIAAAICKSLLGEAVAFNVADISMNSLSELGLVITVGLLLGALAAAYIRLNVWTLKFQKHSVVLRVLAAGVITAIASLFAPEIMGLGYDTIQSTINGTLLVSTVLIILIAKIIVSPIVVGLGMPGGLIGPSLFIGACTGFVCAAAAKHFFPSLDINIGLYVLLGMTGMFAATINAPLAGLIAILELSHNPNIIFPSMLLICVACLTTRHGFHLQGIFVEQLQRGGRKLSFGPTELALKKIGVLSLMSRNFLEARNTVNLEEAQDILTRKPEWIVFRTPEPVCLKASDLANFIEELTLDSETEKAETEINLSDIPGRRFFLEKIKDTDTLYDAWTTLEKSQKQMLYVSSHYSEKDNVLGILDKHTIQEYYQPKI